MTMQLSNQGEDYEGGNLEFRDVNLDDLLQKKGFLCIVSITCAAQSYTCYFWRKKVTSVLVSTDLSLMRFYFIYLMLIPIVLLDLFLIVYHFVFYKKYMFFDLFTTEVRRKIT